MPGGSGCLKPWMLSPGAVRSLSSSMRQGLDFCLLNSSENIVKEHLGSLGKGLCLSKAICQEFEKGMAGMLASLFAESALGFQAALFSFNSPLPSPSGVFSTCYHSPALNLWRQMVFSCSGLRFSSFGLLVETVAREVPWSVSAGIQAACPPGFCLLLLSSPETQVDSP